MSKVLNEAQNKIVLSFLHLWQMTSDHYSSYLELFDNSTCFNIHRMVWLEFSNSQLKISWILKKQKYVYVLYCVDCIDTLTKEIDKAYKQ